MSNMENMAAFFRCREVLFEEMLAETFKKDREDYLDYENMSEEDFEECLEKNLRADLSDLKDVFVKKFSELQSFEEAKKVAEKLCKLEAKIYQKFPNYDFSE